MLGERSGAPVTEAQDDWNNSRPYIIHSDRVEHTGWNKEIYTDAERTRIRRGIIRRKRAVGLRTGSRDTRVPIAVREVNPFDGYA